MSDKISRHSSEPGPHSVCFSPVGRNGEDISRETLEDSAVLFSELKYRSFNPRTNQVTGNVGNSEVVRFLAPILVAGSLSAKKNPIEDALRAIEETHLLGPKTLRTLMHESGERTSGAEIGDLTNMAARISVPDTRAKMDELWSANLLFLQQAKEAAASLQKAKDTLGRMRGLCEHLKYVPEAADRICFPKGAEDIILAVKARHSANPVAVEEGGVHVQCSCDDAPGIGDLLLQISELSLPDGAVQCGHTFHAECFASSLAEMLSEQPSPYPNLHCKCPVCYRQFTLSDLYLLRIKHGSSGRKRKSRPHFKWAERKKNDPSALPRRLAEEFSDDDLQPI